MAPNYINHLKLSKVLNVSQEPKLSSLEVKTGDYNNTI